jgi:hypothetical protein
MITDRRYAADHLTALQLNHNFAFVTLEYSFES